MKYFYLIIFLFSIFGCKKIQADIDEIDSKASVRLCVAEGEREYVRELKKTCEGLHGTDREECNSAVNDVLVDLKLFYENSYEGSQRKEECERKFGA
jgi:hypothetical protein